MNRFVKLSKLTQVNLKINEISQKLQEGKFSKIYNYFRNIYGDYKAVLLETKSDIKQHPVKASAYGLGISIILFLTKTNPTEEQFYQQLVANTNEILTVGDLIRNPESNSHMQRLVQHRNSNLLKRFTFGIFSVMWYDNFGSEVDLYEAHCKYLKVGWLSWKDRIVDYGIMGRWRKLDNAMIDYDINPSEWTNDGKKLIVS